MSTTTQNYGLHQWEAGDNFLRTDFNEDNAKIDAALAGTLKIVTGQYEGTYAGGATLVTQQIELGFRPKAVIIFPHSENMNGYWTHSALVLDGSSNNGATINDSGFEVTGQTNLAYSSDINQAHCNPYRYIAFY